MPAENIRCADCEHCKSHAKKVGGKTAKTIDYRCAHFGTVCDPQAVWDACPGGKRVYVEKPALSAG